MIRTTPSRRSPAVLLSISLLLVLAGAAGSAAASTSPASAEEPADDVSITVTNATTGDDETATIRLTLTEAPDGLAGYRVTVELRATGVATVTEASYPDAYGMTTDPRIGPDGRSVTLEAIDLDDRISDGATGVPLATVTVSGENAGETAVELTDVQVDADGGDRVGTDAESGLVTVTGKSDASSPAASTRTGSDGAPESGDSNAASDSDASGVPPLLAGVALLVAALLAAALVSRRN